VSNDSTSVMPRRSVVGAAGAGLASVTASGAHAQGGGPDAGTATPMVHPATEHPAPSFFAVAALARARARDGVTT
jgi:hypothetical protein